MLGIIEEQGLSHFFRDVHYIHKELRKLNPVPNAFRQVSPPAKSDLNQFNHEEQSLRQKPKREDGELNFFRIREQRPDQRQVPASDVDDSQDLPSGTSVCKLAVDDAFHAWFDVEAVAAVGLGNEGAQMIIVKDQHLI
jgi:hypothetical protein